MLVQDQSQNQDRQTLRESVLEGVKLVVLKIDDNENPAGHYYGYRILTFLQILKGEIDSAQKHNYRLSRENTHDFDLYEIKNGLWIDIADN